MRLVLLLRRLCAAMLLLAWVGAVSAHELAIR